VNVIRGDFYEFHAERVVSRSGQSLETKEGIEIGPRIRGEKRCEMSKQRKMYTRLLWTMPIDSWAVAKTALVRM